MAIMNVAKRSGRGLAVAAALVAAVSFTAAPGTAYAQHHGGGGIGTGAAVGLGVGAFALGALATGAYYNPYYAPYGYGYPQAAYYPQAPAYYPTPRNCWDPYYRRYYAC